jgi:hypothetical protein
VNENRGVPEYFMGLIGDSILTYLYSLSKYSMWAFKSFVVSLNILCYMSIGILIWALLQGLAS